MPTYVVTGISKGIGLELFRQVSADENNTIIGLVRDKAGTEKKIAAELGTLHNAHILYGDLTNYASLEQAAADVAKIVGDDGIDYLIASAAYVSQIDQYGPVGALADKPDVIESTSRDLFSTNVIGNIHFFNLFLPLVLKGKTKKVFAISSGLADLDFTNNLEVEIAALYAASKGALNVIVAKYNAQYKKQGVLFTAVSPGVVEVGHFSQATPEQLEAIGGFAGKLAGYAPDFKGPISPKESVLHLRQIFETASIENGFAGAFVSHFGNKQWV